MLKILKKSWSIRFALAMACSVFSMTSSAEPETMVLANGAFVANSCGYYSTTSAKFAISYWNPLLSQDSKVSMHYGFEYETTRDPENSNETQVRDWEKIADANLNPMGNDTFEVQMETIIHNRSSLTPAWTGLNFVFKISNPGQPPIYDKGNSTELGFYRMTWNMAQIGCGTDFPEPSPLKIESIYRSYSYQPTPSQ